MYINLKNIFLKCFLCIYFIAIVNAEVTYHLTDLEETNSGDVQDFTPDKSLLNSNSMSLANNL